jgi:hypothetical protein
MAAVLALLSTLVAAKLQLIQQWWLPTFDILDGCTCNGNNPTISSFDDDLLDGSMKLVPLLISRLIYCYEHTCFNLKLELQLNLNEWCWIWAFYTSTGLK